jgi:putative endonuclease
VLSPKQRKFPHFVLGDTGERLAQQFLLHKKYSLLEVNAVFKKSEIDIIGIDPVTKELVFFEVKTRKTEHYGHPSQAVGKKKLRSLQKGAQLFLQYTGLQNFYRFDIITVTLDTIEHFENVTWP